jgi:hypothetical protein
VVRRVGVVGGVRVSWGAGSVNSEECVVSKKCEVSCPGCGRPGTRSTGHDQCAAPRFVLGVGWVRCSPKVRRAWLVAADEEK